MTFRRLRGLLQPEQLLLRQIGQASTPLSPGDLGQLWAHSARLHANGHLVLLQRRQELALSNRKAFVGLL